MRISNRGSRSVLAFSKPWLGDNAVTRLMARPLAVGFLTWILVTGVMGVARSGPSEAPDDLARSIRGAACYVTAPCPPQSSCVDYCVMTSQQCDVPVVRPYLVTPASGGKKDDVVLCSDEELCFYPVLSNINCTGGAG